MEYHLLPELPRNKYMRWITFGLTPPSGKSSWASFYLYLALIHLFYLTFIGVTVYFASRGHPLSREIDTAGWLVFSFAMAIYISLPGFVVHFQRRQQRTAYRELIFRHVQVAEADFLAEVDRENACLLDGEPSPPEDNS